MSEASSPKDNDQLLRGSGSRRLISFFHPAIFLNLGLPEYELSVLLPWHRFLGYYKHDRLDDIVQLILVVEDTRTRGISTFTGGLTFLLFMALSE
jgi:hypothetical protein